MYDKMGLFRFGKKYFPDVFSHPFANHHYDLAKIFWELYRPERTNRIDRQAYVVIHREAAKTTLMTFLVPNYLIWLRGLRPWVRFDKEGWEGSDLHDYDIIQLPEIREDLIMICSETSRTSEAFVMNVKNHVSDRKDMHKLFGNKNPKLIQLDDEDIKGDTVWRQNAFITADGTALLGKGAGQQVRGTNIRNHRPSLIIADDIYSSNNTKTPERRETINKWFYAELTNSADTVKGKTIFNGTIVNRDTVPVHIQGSSDWFGINKPIISYDELQEVIEKHCTFTDMNTVIVPDRKTCDEIQKGLTTLSWPDRQNLYYILKLYKREYDQGRISYFYQEYLNITEAPEEAKFDRDKLRSVKVECVIENNEWLLKMVWKDREWYALPNLTLGLDLASSESRLADDTVLVAAGLHKWHSMIPNTNREESFVAPLIYYIEGGKGYGIYAETRSNKQFRRGYVDSIIDIAKAVPIREVVIECNNAQENVYREAHKKLGEMKFPGQITRFVSQDNKVDRIVGVMEPIWQKYPHFFYNEKHSEMILGKFWTQLQGLGPDKGHDDYPDAVSIALSRSRVNLTSFRYSSFGVIGNSSIPILTEHSVRRRNLGWEVR